MNEPLAQRLRPKTLADVCGQQHLLAEGQVFRRTIESGRIPNMIFYGPSGTGKTTVARIIAENSGMTLHKLNGTSCGTGDIKAVLKDIGTLAGAGGILLTTARTLEAVMRRLGFSGSFDMTDTYALIGLAAGFALATAVAVLALSARDEGRHQALLRTLGLTPRGVAAAVAWQSALVALGAALLSLVPIACSSLAALALTWMFWGAPAAYAPLPEALAAGAVVWAALLAARWTQVRGAVRSSPAACLRS